MKSVPRIENENNVYLDVYRLLIAGMVISTALFAIALIVALLHPQTYPLSPDWLRRQYHWDTFIRGLRARDANSFAMLATFILILTPISRVIVSIWAFFVDRDYRFVAVTGTVLVVILLSVFLGLLGLQ